MARAKPQELEYEQDEYLDSNKTAVIYLRGPRLDSGTAEARDDAGSKGCRVFYRNENYYDHSPEDERVAAVDYCYTDDEGIAAEYKAAGIEVVQLKEAKRKKKQPSKEELLQAQVRKLEGQLKQSQPAAAI